MKSTINTIEQLKICLQGNGDKVTMGMAGTKNKDGCT
jgi:hypothetical protein